VGIGEWWNIIGEEAEVVRECFVELLGRI